MMGFLLSIIAVCDIGLFDLRLSLLLALYSMCKDSINWCYVCTVVGYNNLDYRLFKSVGFVCDLLSSESYVVAVWL